MSPAPSRLKPGERPSGAGRAATWGDVMSPAPSRLKPGERPSGAGRAATWGLL